VRFAHAYGWHVAVPSNAADAVGLLRAAMRGVDPTVFFEHRSLLMTSDGSAPYPGDDYVLPFGRARVLRAGDRITVVTWGAMVHRCVEAAAKFGDAVELIDLRTVAPWDKAAVLASVEKTGRCLVVHEDNLTAGFGAEIAATIAGDAFWHLDAPVERLAPEDIPVAYHTDLLNAIVPTAERIGERIEHVLSV
jgi:2-oxoisovalerate dehydrogenase E1 component